MEIPSRNVLSTKSKMLVKEVRESAEGEGGKGRGGGGGGGGGVGFIERAVCGGHYIEGADGSLPRGNSQVPLLEHVVVV